MAIHKAEIIVSNGEAAFIREALRDWRLMGEDDVITHTAVFSDGTEVDVKCVGCQDEFEEEDDSEAGCSQPSWTEAVLFRNGYEISCSEPGDLYFGRWELADRDGNMYVVDVTEAASP